MKNRTIKLWGVLALAVAMATAGASAETLRASATRLSNDTGNTSGVLKPLDDAGHTSLAFKTSASNSLVKITYNAECAVLGTGPQEWVTVSVFVDGVQANPQNGDDFALCTTLPNGVDFQWVGAVRQSLIKVPSIGTHNVQIVVDLNAGATEWWLGDTSLVVESQP
jgi:hypothetical protein